MARLYEIKPRQKIIFKKKKGRYWTDSHWIWIVELAQLVDSTLRRRDGPGQRVGVPQRCWITSPKTERRTGWEQRLMGPNLEVKERKRSWLQGLRKTDKLEAARALWSGDDKARVFWEEEGWMVQTTARRSSEAGEEAVVRCGPLAGSRDLLTLASTLGCADCLLWMHFEEWLSYRYLSINPSNSSGNPLGHNILLQQCCFRYFLDLTFLFS